MLDKMGMQAVAFYGRNYIVSDAVVAELDALGDQPKDDDVRRILRAAGAMRQPECVA